MRLQEFEPCQDVLLLEMIIAFHADEICYTEAQAVMDLKSTLRQISYGHITESCSSGLNTSKDAMPWCVSCRACQKACCQARLS